jgi:PKD repeat protein
MKRIILLGLIIFSFTAKSQEFNSNDDCKAGFTFGVNHEVMTFAPATVLNFYDTSEGNVKEWFWDFGEGTKYVSEQNPIHIFNHPLGGLDVKINPYRTVTLTIKTDSCKSVYSQTINIMDLSDTINHGCFAQFSYYETGRDTTEGTAKIAFINFSAGENLSYSWQFGDDSTSTDKDPVVKFRLDQPEHKVCLTVIGADSCSNIFCDAVVLANDLPWFPGDDDTTYTDTTWHNCNVSFGYERKDLLMTPLPSAIVNFYSKSDPPATEWYWDFGDGTTSKEPDPTHIYIQQVWADSMGIDSFNNFTKPAFNPYRTVCLTVKTADECKVSYCETIQVFDYNPYPEPVGCQAYFKYYKPDDLITIPEVVPVHLTDASEGKVISRLWQFEDGSTSAEKELLKTFSIFQPVHKVCLTVTFADSCVNTFCDAVFVNGVVIDTVFPEPDCPYTIKIDGGFPPKLSSCAGWASASVFLNDSLVKPLIFSWSTGDTLPNVTGLCPTQTYSVKALMPEGCTVYTDFILNADGTITDVPPMNWWISGEREKFYVCFDAPGEMKVEWKLCDGTIVEADSIPLDAINCGGNESNMIVKDAQGNIVYSENISLKGSFTNIPDISEKTEIKMWPNPVEERLNIRYSGKFQNSIRVEILDIMGKRVAEEVFADVSGGREIELKTGALVTGIYVCRITSDGQLISNQKFSKK